MKSTLPNIRGNVFLITLILLLVLGFLLSALPKLFQHQQREQETLEVVLGLKRARRYIRVATNCYATWAAAPKPCTAGTSFSLRGKDGAAHPDLPLNIGRTIRVRGVCRGSGNQFHIEYSWDANQWKNLFPEGVFLCAAYLSEP